MIRKFRFYKRALQVTLAVNVFFIALGCVAAGQYFKTHEVVALQLVIVGAATLVFGFLLPLYLLARVTAAMNEARMRTEAAVAKWVSGWLENYRQADDPIRDPYFWLNIVLMSVEVFGEGTENAAFKFVADFAPILRTELKKQAPSSKPRNSRQRGSSKANPRKPDAA